ncbi:MAG: 2-amino-4-hydroxy-6-hydroxymethyldihydropteridine diphosphokinase [Pseudomonadota bacterium]|jgi:2-amino-4-hydroxy-6-hydroxymethyldihydropteridine diphosphokinase
MPNMITCYIGVGANLGNAHHTVKTAITRLGEIPHCRLLGQSNLFLSAPVDAGGDDFCNAVVELGTTLAPHELLGALQQIEQDFGRERPYRNAPRTLDLDLLLYGNHKIQSDDLEVPHPRLHQRAFALKPLLQLCPGIELPGLGPGRSYLPAVSHQTISEIY